MVQPAHAEETIESEVQIRSDSVSLSGDLAVPSDATGVVLFAHASGSARYSPRNQFVARTIREAGVGTLLFDLLSREEESLTANGGQLRFDIRLLAHRLLDATEWIQREFHYLKVGYFGSGTGGGAALVAAAQLGAVVGAVVSQGGRPDLAGDFLSLVKSPTLLIVGGRDTQVIQMNQYAYSQLQCEKRLEIVRGARHLFREPGTLAEVARLASNWFRERLMDRH